ncbi:hypothetical protein [Paenibacillus sp. NEAU-GSW1]|uniref:hypothetical protein n=1 Tax=Paenibacillus sp. NEAU-GSW1 TaxID=2682486 RepID=UPI0020A66923|nr:hypothetical protein [Paenibacillus sp. NEAU-GSW1]
MLAKVGVSGTIASGMALGGIGFLLLTHLSASGNAWGVIPGTIIIGIGQAHIKTDNFNNSHQSIRKKESVTMQFF